MGSRVIIPNSLMAMPLEVYHRDDFEFGFLVLVASVSPLSLRVETLLVKSVFCTEVDRLLQLPIGMLGTTCGKRGCARQPHCS